MKIKVVMTTGILFVVVCGIALTSCGPSKQVQLPQAPSEVAVGLSPFLKDRERIVEDVTQWISTLGGTRVYLFDGWTGASICSFDVPRLKYYREEAVWRQIGPEALRQLISWARKPCPEESLLGTGALRTSELLEQIARSIGHPPSKLVILGSPLYRSSVDSRWDFQTNGFWFPSDGHLASEVSTFSCVGKSELLLGASVYYLFPGEETTKWPDKYAEKLRRFYAGFMAAQGASLTVFTSDLPAGLRLVTSEVGHPIEIPVMARDEVAMLPAVPEEISAKEEPSQNRPTIVKEKAHPVEEPVEVVAIPHSLTNAQDTINIASVVSVPDAPPAVFVEKEAAPKPPPEPSAPKRPFFPPHKDGVMSVGIQWPGSEDLDLVLTPKSGENEINSRSASRYYHDFDPATKKQMEWIELDETNVDLAKVKLWLHFVRGVRGPIACDLFLQNKGNQSIGRVSIQGPPDERFRTFTRSRSKAWQRVDLLRVVAESQPSQIQ